MFYTFKNKVRMGNYFTHLLIGIVESHQAMLLPMQRYCPLNRKLFEASEALGSGRNTDSGTTAYGKRIRNVAHRGFSWKLYSAGPTLY